MELTITPMAGNFGRPFFRSPNTGQQRHYRGGLVDLSDADVAQAQLRALVRSKRVTHMEVLIGTDKSKILKTLPLTTAPIPLAGPAADTDTALAMLTPLASPRPQQYQQDGPPATGSDWTMFMYRQQEQRLEEQREQNRDLKDQLRIQQEVNRTQKQELDKTNLDLQLRDRLHAADLRDVRSELEGNAAPKGVAGALAGLPPEASSALMNGLMGMAAKFMGMDGGPGAAGAGNQLALPAGTSPQMHNIAIAATEIIPDSQVGADIMVALSRIIPNPAQLTQFFTLAGMNPQSHQPQPQV